MSAALARSRDRAVSTLRTLVVALVLLGLTATGALAGVFARQPAFGEEEAAGTEAPPAPAKKQGQRVQPGKVFLFRRYRRRHHFSLDAGERPRSRDTAVY